MRNLFLAVFLTHVLSMTSANAAPPQLATIRTMAKNLLPSGDKVKALLQKIPQKALVIGAAGVILCASLTSTGCERGRSYLDVTDTEYVDPNDENAGQYVSFELDGYLYEGYWEITPEGQLLIEIDDSYDRILLHEYTVGKVIKNHPDIGAYVVVQGWRNGHEVDKYGEVYEVYDNGFYVILIDEVVYVHNNISIKVNETLLVNPNFLAEDGGLEFLDE